MKHRVGTMIRASVALGVLLAATLTGAVLAPVAAVDAATGALTPINPNRYADTRAGRRTVDGEFEGVGRLAGGAELAVTLAGRPGVPADATAVMMNVTAVRPDGPGHVTVYPCGTKRPNVSNINYSGGDVSPNAVLSKLGTAGQVCVYSLRGTDLIIDVNAYVPAAGSPVPIDPVRNVDTRESSLGAGTQNPGRLSAGKEYEFTIAGASGVPGNAVAAMMNITAVRPDGAGFVTVYPCGTDRPIVSNINYAGGDVAPNAVLSKLGAGGKVCVYSLRPTDLIIDVNAYVPAGGQPIPIDPVRYADTRAGQLTVDGKDQGTGRLAGNTEHRFTIAGRPGVPKNATAAMMNITAVRPASLGFLTVYPCGTERPIASSNNYYGGDVAPNAVLSKLGANGQVCIYSVAATDLIIDINGYVTDTQTPTAPKCVIAGKTVDTKVTGPECTALVDLYNSTDGPHWKRFDHWNTPTDPCTWFGIKCDPSGKLVSLSLIRKGLKGRLPNSIGNLTNLEVLSLSANRLRGRLPASIGNLSNLEVLGIQEAALSGELPRSLGNLKNLELLVLSENQLSGPIPANLGQLSRLHTISIGNNELTGTIPSSLGDLNALEGLHLSSNQLTGQIPSTFGNLGSLKALFLNDNQLSGPVPPTIMRLNLDLLMLAGNGCFTAANPALATWLTNHDPNWNDGC